MTNRLLTKLRILIQSLSGILLLMTLITSCLDGVVFEKNFTVESGNWHKDQLIEIDFTIQDTIYPVDLYFNLRHSTDYQYSNLFLFIDTYYPDGQQARDTLEIIIASYDGKWLGKGLGKIKALNVPLRQGLIFPMKGPYSFTIRQAMREEKLTGIEDVGITIEKAR